MVTYIEIKKLYLSNIVLFILLLFVIMYIIYNYDYIRQEKFFDGQVAKPVLITGILFLIIHMLMTWDDDIDNIDNIDDIDNIEIPKYKLGQNTNESRNEIVATKIDDINKTNFQPINSVESVTKKYKIINKTNSNIFVKSNENKLENKLSNQDIFINKRQNKYGLKFL